MGFARRRQWPGGSEGPAPPSRRRGLGGPPGRPVVDVHSSESLPTARRRRRACAQPSKLDPVEAGGRTRCCAVAIVAGGRCLVQPNMLPFETPSIFDQLPRFVFKMPRVVPDQKAKFESDELFRRLSRECETRYTGYRDRPLEERQVRFQNACREGHTEVVSHQSFSSRHVGTRRRH
ncbi:hypothetical protein ISCGN_000294 [Ixodes scapularis]